MPDQPGWVTDTSVYTHLSRAGHLDMLGGLAPGGIVLVPTDVQAEIEAGRETYAGIESVDGVSWASLTPLTEDEAFTQIQIKAAMGGDGRRPSTAPG